MKKFFDCSINDISNSNHGGSSLGPIENDVMFDLGKYSNYFGWERTYDYKQSDLIITNGFYTNDILKWSEKYSIPKIKRMDGVYWQNNLKYKNDIYNKAALQSNHVIFISDYSKTSLFELYNFLPNEYSVILNDVDEEIFFPSKNKYDNFTFVSSATNWEREQKRLDSIILLSKVMDKIDTIRLIGKCDVDLPENIIKEGYINDGKQMNEIINKSDVFLSLFFRDAGSKVTYQSIRCNVPVLYSNTGGLPEIVGISGIQVDDYTDINFMNDTPMIDLDVLYDKYRLIKNNYKDITFDKRKSYKDTLSEYFKVMDKF